MSVPFALSVVAIFIATFALASALSSARRSDMFETMLAAHLAPQTEPKEPTPAKVGPLETVAADEPATAETEPATAETDGDEKTPGNLLGWEGTSAWIAGGGSTFDEAARRLMGRPVGDQTAADAVAVVFDERASDTPNFDRVRELLTAAQDV